VKLISGSPAAVEVKNDGSLLSLTPTYAWHGLIY
jgi:hypothetical protein